ncbi:MAG: lipopolysaccharide biosynthesis protein [Planctomycetes bacterium]|nr:lipopolysaccharide biosynthesis protein [Planctomycetota bacterium]
MKRVKNFLSLAGAEALSKLLTFAAYAYIARVAGPGGMGLLEFAAAVLLCASLVVEQGFSAYGAREIARRPAAATSLACQIVSLRLLLALPAYAALALFALALGRGAVQTQLLLLYGVSLLGLPFLWQWIFQGHERMHAVGALQLVRQGAFAAVVFAGFRADSPLWVVAAAEIAGVAAAAALGIRLGRRQLNVCLRLTARIDRSMVREGLTIGLSQIFWSTKMFGATLLVGLVAVPEQTGYFAAAMRILLAMHTFVWLYYFNILPALARAWHGDAPAFHALVRESTRGVAWLALAGGALWLLLAPAVAGVVYGEAFAPSGVVLQWLGGVCVLAALSGHFRYGLIAAGRQTAEMVVSLVGAVAAVVLVPWAAALKGPTGAAAALVTAEAVIWLVSWAYSRRLLDLTGHWRCLVRPVCATGGALALAAVSASAGTACQVCVAAAVLGLAALSTEPGLRALAVRTFLPRRVAEVR